MRERSGGMRWWWLLFLGWCYPLFSFAQIRGTVTNASGQPVATAMVTLQHTSHGAYTNDSGWFTLPALSPGNYILQVVATGYEVLMYPVTLSEINPALKLHLQPVNRQLEELTVTGVTRATALRKNPVPIAILTPAELARNAGSNIIDAVVKGIPGITGVTTGPNITKPFVRGLGYNRVLTLFDGVRQEGQQWGDEHGIEA
ncbi:MAG: TonB-dependent receptor, partial [Chitinophagia bacterium]|nr:TonB-dependent receptor [Chitinophagia bacterium]